MAKASKKPKNGANGKVLAKPATLQRRRTRARNEGVRDAALVVRRTWLKMMGLSDDEIENDIRDNPLDLDEEIANLSAMNEIQKLNEFSSGKK